MALAMTKPLPPGWEKRTTVMGQTYFLNHLTKETCWKGPPGTEIGVSLILFLKKILFYFNFNFFLFQNRNHLIIHSPSCFIQLL